MAGEVNSTPSLDSSGDPDNRYEGHKLAYVVPVSPQRVLVSEVGKPRRLGRHLGKPLIFGAGQNPFLGRKRNDSGLGCRGEVFESDKIHYQTLFGGTRGVERILCCTEMSGVPLWLLGELALFAVGDAPVLEAPRQVIA